MCGCGHCWCELMLCWVPCDKFIDGPGFIVGLRALFVLCWGLLIVVSGLLLGQLHFWAADIVLLFHCWGEFIVVWGSFVGPVSLLGGGHCWCSFIVGKVHCCMAFIVGVGFIDGSWSLLVVVNCWGGFIVVKFIVVVGFIVGRGHCLCCFIVGASSLLCGVHC